MKNITHTSIAAIYWGKSGVDGPIFNKIIDVLKNHHPYRVHINLYTQTGKNQTYQSKEVTILHHIIDFPYLPRFLSHLLFSLLAVFLGAAHSKHLLFLDKFSALFLPIAKIFPKRNIIVSPMFKSAGEQPLLGNKTIGRLASLFTARYADTIIFPDIKTQSKYENKHNIKTNVIAYGGDHAISTEDIGSTIIKKYPFLFGRYAFATVDVEDTVSTDAILEAFERFENYPLAVFGNWEGSEHGIGLKDRYALCPNIKVLDNHIPQGTVDLIRAKCYVYVHGDEMGGGSLQLIEAMNKAVPIVAFDEAHNRDLTHNQAMYFKDVDELYDILNETVPYKLLENGGKMQSIAREEYQWKKYVEQYFHIIDKNMGAEIKNEEMPQRNKLMSKIVAI